MPEAMRVRRLSFMEIRYISGESSRHTGEISDEFKRVGDVRWDSLDTTPVAGVFVMQEEGCRNNI